MKLLCVLNVDKNIWGETRCKLELASAVKQLHEANVYLHSQGALRPSFILMITILPCNSSHLLVNFETDAIKNDLLISFSLF